MPEFVLTVHAARSNPVHRITKEFILEAVDQRDAENDAMAAASLQLKNLSGYSAYHVTDVLSVVAA